MRRVECSLRFHKDDEERKVVTVCCGRCDHEVTIYGHSEASVRRGCATLRDECPHAEENFYVYEEGDLQEN